MRRGIVNYSKRIKQTIKFLGLKWGNITPTDIDGFIDFQNEFFIWFEIKLVGIDLPYGQRLAYKRLVDNCRLPSIAIVAHHDVTDPEEDVMARDTIVREFYYNGRWRVPQDEEEITLGEAIRRFIKKQRATT